MLNEEIWAFGYFCGSEILERGAARQLPLPDPPASPSAAASHQSARQRVPRSPMRLKPPPCYQLQSPIRTWPFPRHKNRGWEKRWHFTPNGAGLAFMCWWGSNRTASFDSQTSASWKHAQGPRLIRSTRIAERGSLDGVNPAKHTTEHN